MPLTTHREWQYTYPLRNKCMWENATYRRSGWNLGRGEHKGKTKYQGRQLRLLEVAEVCDSLWLIENKPWREIMNGQCLRSQRQHSLTLSTRFNPEAYTAPAVLSRNSAFRSSLIGLANKLVQFKKRPLYSCSLKAAYTKTYEKNLWYKELQNTKNFTLTFKSILLYIHKRGCKINMTEEERRSKVMFADDARHLQWSCSCGIITHSCLHPFLLQPESKANDTVFLTVLPLKTYTVQGRNLAVLLTPGLWSALSCRPKRLLPWPPCRGEAVAEDSRLGDWAIIGEFGVDVRAPVSVRRCSSLCLCCCSIWHTTTCCSW